MKEEQKVRFADGLRGVAAFAVFFHHYLVAFSPRVYDYIFPGLQHSSAVKSRVDAILSLPGFTLFLNGQFPVCIFFVLSGYVLARPACLHGDLEKLRERCFDRVFRLGIPCAVAIWASFILFKAHLYFTAPASLLSHSDWLQRTFSFVPTFGSAARDSLFGAVVGGDVKYDGPMWTMRIELIGSLLLFAFYCLVLRNCFWVSTLIFLGLIYSILKPNEWYYFGLFAGSLIYRIPKIRGSGILAVLFLFGCILGSNDFSPWYTWLPRAHITDSQIFYYTIGALLWMYTLECGLFRAFFSWRPFCLLGKISFSLYLLHLLVLCSFSCWFYVRFHDIMSPWLLAVLNFALSTLIVLGVSVIFEKYVDQFAINFPKKMFRNKLCK